MEKIHELAFRTIQIRSQISEALCLYATEWGSSNSILNAAGRSSDVIEHIAQYTLEGVNHDMQANLLVQDLTTALFLISEFERELKKSRRNVPDIIDINLLISEIKQSFQIPLQQDA
ncbi:hypothetical protein HCK70_002169 [Salmonella enterica]|nr:hypothetical protein [Salmonella enterica]